MPATIVNRTRGTVASCDECRQACGPTGPEAQAAWVRTHNANRHPGFVTRDPAPRNQHGPMRPARKSMTRRRKYAQDARRTLAGYLSRVDARYDDATVERKVRDLLWVQAYAQRALYWETNGRLGDRHATPQSVDPAALKASGGQA